MQRCDIDTLRGIQYTFCIIACRDTQSCGVTLSHNVNALMLIQQSTGLSSFGMVLAVRIYWY
jgi:hypothetical protein